MPAAKIHHNVLLAPPRGEIERERRRALRRVDPRMVRMLRRHPYRRARKMAERGRVPWEALEVAYPVAGARLGGNPGGARAYKSHMTEAAQAAREGDLERMREAIAAAEDTTGAMRKSGEPKPKHIEQTLKLWRMLREAREMPREGFEVTTGGVERPRWITAGAASSGVRSRRSRPKYAPKPRGLRQWEREYMSKLKGAKKMRNRRRKFNRRRQGKRTVWRSLRRDARGRFLKRGRKGIRRSRKSPRRKLRRKSSSSWKKIIRMKGLTMKQKAAMYRKRRR